jgi:HK97 family phage portal protein
MKYTPIGISPEQAQFLETRKFQIDEIARIFRVPPHMVGDLEKSSFSNIEQQSLEFVKYTLDPWVSRWEQSISARSLPRREKAVFREVQRRRAASRRLPEPHERVRRGPPERLDVRKRHP